jgi:regulation of enolase protein 1 (concanavalin A-like superfamily)
MALSPRNTGDNHGSRLRGWVHPPATGDYVFAIAADDVAELWLSSSDRPMDAIRIATCDSWSDVAEFHLRAATQRSRPIPLQAGRRYYIEARHREGTGNDHVDIAWEGPGFHQQVIEGAFLSPWHDMIADGIGLTGSYWQGKASFAGFPVVVRVDPTVDSAWNGVAPTPGLGSSDFTVRWSGSVLAPASGTFTFTTTSDDGVRLWVDGQPVISHWNDHATASDSGICVLTAGRRHRLVMEYYQGGGGAVARLAWSGPSITSQIIPASHLYPDPFPAMGGALPAGWCSFGLGDGAGHGSAGVLDGVWTVTSAGGDIWDRADGCQFVGQAVIGDVQITARVQRLQATHAWSKAGVMIREFATAGARQAFMAVTPASGIAFQRRLQPDGPSSHTAGVRAAAPYWVRLVRSGTAISAWQSPDNAVWTRIGTATVAMGTTVQVGLAVSSHASDSATAIIDQVKIINAPQGSG